MSIFLCLFFSVNFFGSFKIGQQLGGWTPVSTKVSIFLGTYIGYFVSTNILSPGNFCHLSKRKLEFFVLFFLGVILLISGKKNCQIFNI